MRLAPVLPAALLLASATALEPGVEIRAAGGRLSVRAEKVPLAEVIDHLARQTGMRVIYEGLPPRQLVTLTLSGRTHAEAVLGVLEGQGLNYAVVMDPAGTRVETLMMAGAAPAPAGAPGAPPYAPGAHAPPEPAPPPPPEPQSEPDDGADLDPILSPPQPQPERGAQPPPSEAQPTPTPPPPPATTPSLFPGNPGSPSSPFAPVSPFQPPGVQPSPPSPQAAPSPEPGGSESR